MSTFLIISVSPRKEIEIKELEVPDDEDGVDLEETLKQSADPPFNGKSIVVDKKYTRTFRLNCSIVETNR